LRNVTKLALNGQKGLDTNQSFCIAILSDFSNMDHVSLSTTRSNSEN
jgi:hypothetical protein